VIWRASCYQHGIIPSRTGLRKFTTCKALYSFTCNSHSSLVLIINLLNHVPEIATGILSLSMIVILSTYFYSIICPIPLL
jgi:hypothetical protein